MKKAFTLFFLVFINLISSQTPPSSNPLFRNSVASNDIDFIKSTDPDAFESLAYIGRERQELPGSLNGNLFDNAYIFESTFSRSKRVQIWCHSTFGSRAAAQEYAEKVSPRIGKLPRLMLDRLSHVIIHDGDDGAFAESEAQFFVLYSENMDLRISNNDLEETVFHESIHATLDEMHLNNVGWTTAQDRDVNFITNYAQQNSFKEDFAETALFAYTMQKYPGRLSASVEDWVNTHIPNRIAYINTNVFSEGQGPVVSITSPEDGAQFTLGEEIILSASASDPGGNLDKVNFKLNDAFYRTDRTRPFETTFTPTEAGIYKIAARAFNSDNQQTEVFVTIVVNELNQAPEIFITEPADGAEFELGEEIQLSANALDADGNFEKINFKVNDAFYQTFKGTPFETTFMPSEVGTYKIAARAFDTDNEQTEVFVTITIKAQNQAPTVSITSPADGAQFSLGEEIMLSANASDLDGNLDRVNFKINDSFYKTDNSNPFEVSYIPVEIGTYKIAARAFDSEGLSTEVFVNVIINDDITLSNNNNQDGTNVLSAVKAFPVPAKSVLHVVGIPDTSKLAVFDVSGRRIKSINNNKPTIKIDISNFSGGLYFLRLDNGVSHKTIRFVKN